MRSEKAKSSRAAHDIAHHFSLILTLLVPSWLGCHRAGVEQRLGVVAETVPPRLAAKETPAEPTAKASVSSSVSGPECEAAADLQPTAPADRGERLLLLLPGGPLLIELRVTVDGQPLREPREELVQEMLKLADRNGDGRPTWGEVFADPKRVFGQPLKLSSRKEFMKANDTNRNGLVDPDEARRLIEEIKDSEAVLSVASITDYPLSGARQSIVRRLLDTDGDDLLDRRELSALEPRLLIRDANDDRIVTWSELDDTLAADELALAPRKTSYRGEPLARLLPQRADAALDVGEPHIVLAVGFGKATEKQGPRLRLERLPPAAQIDGPGSRTQVSVSFRAAGCRVRFLVDERTSPAERSPSHLSAIYAAVFEEQDVVFSLLDANHDHRLTTHELLGGTAALAPFDTDGDGRIASEEVPEVVVVVLGRGAPPEARAITHTLPSIDDAKAIPDWFQHMDANGDREVSRDEFPGSSEKFCAIDLDRDGYITADEVNQADLAAHR